MSKVLAATFAAQYIFVSSAMAWPATTTTRVNMRSGPGTNFNALGTLDAGAKIEVSDCDEGAQWCAVETGDKTGFVSGQYLQPAEEDEAPAPWPRQYDTDSGASIVLHQPQITEWEDYRKATALIAAEFRPKKDADPHYGVIEIKADTDADQTDDTVVISNLTVTKLTFSTLERKQLNDIALKIGEAIPTEPITMSFARLAASLEGFQSAEKDVALNTDAPPIFARDKAAILLQTNGEAVTGPVADTVKDLSFVINTNWDLFKLETDGSWYLRVEKSWLHSKDLASGWQPASDLPEPFSKLPDDDNWGDARAAMPPAPFEDGAVPEVVYSDKPAELIVITGEPDFEDVPETSLKWVKNTESDLFFDEAGKTWYFLTSGRWFRAAALDGPWTFASTDLPEDFLRIPDNAPYATVRASIPGTSEAAEARLRASIPQMARVETGSVSVDVDYGGDPKFAEIKGTTVAYAENASETVLRVGDKYYVVKDGVWFVGDSPTGPFEMARQVPDEIYKIPPSSPVYNVTYVRVYESSPDAVWYGYTSGYLWSFAAWGALAYGTGWYYRPYWYSQPGWRYPIYYPRPVHFGMGAYYNPVRGSFGRYGYAYGPYRGIGVAARYNPRTGTYVRAGRVSGPYGSRGFVHAYNPRTNTAAFARGGRGVYGSWGSAGVKRGSEWARESGRVRTANRGGANWHRPDAGRGAGARRGGGNVFAGRDGNVYRRNNGQWQQRTNNGWKNAPGAGQGARQGAGQRAGGQAARPNAQARPNRPAATRPAQRTTQRARDNDLMRQFDARQRGNRNAVRNYNYNSINRSPARSQRNFGGGGGGSFRGGGGGFRGGGGGFRGGGRRR